MEGLALVSFSSYLANTTIRVLTMAGAQLNDLPFINLENSDEDVESDGEADDSDADSFLEHNKHDDEIDDDGKFNDMGLEEAEGRGWGRCQQLPEIRLVPARNSKVVWQLRPQDQGQDQQRPPILLLRPRPAGPTAATTCFEPLSRTRCWAPYSEPHQ